MLVEGMLKNSNWMHPNESKRTKVYGLLYENVDARDLTVDRIAKILTNLNQYKIKCRTLPYELIIDHYQRDDLRSHVYAILRYPRRVSILNPNSFSINGYVPRVWKGIIDNERGNRTWLDHLTVDIRHTYRQQSKNNSITRTTDIHLDR